MESGGSRGRSTTAPAAGRSRPVGLELPATDGNGDVHEHAHDLATGIRAAQNAAMGGAAINLDDLSPEEQLQLLEEIWDRLSQNPAALPLSPEQSEELDRRLDAFEEDVRSGRPLGSPWSEVRERLRSR